MDQNNEKIFENRYWLAFIVYMILANFIAVSFPQQARYFTSESNFYQNVGAVALFVAILFLIATIWLGWKTELKALPFRKLWYTGFTGVLVLALGEEISWGQHLFKFEVPASIREINEQQEFNLHNLSYLHGLNSDKSQKSGLLRWVTAHRLFYSFLAVFLVVLPLMTFLSGFIKARMQKIQMIVPARWTGFVFICAVLLTRTFQLGFPDVHPEIYHTLAEVMEVHIELVLLTVAIIFYLNQMKFGERAQDSITNS